MVGRIREVVLYKKQLQHGTLDDTVTWSNYRVLAHVTEVNGAQVQNDMFGKQYDMTWVARIRGNHFANSIAFPVDGVKDDELDKMNVIQVRKHATRTDIYFAKDREEDADELEQ